MSLATGATKRSSGTEGTGISATIGGGSSSKKVCLESQSPGDSCSDIVNAANNSGEDKKVRMAVYRWQLGHFLQHMPIMKDLQKHQII